jgi:hypothetical protein
MEMSIRRILTLAALGLGALAPLAASAAPVAVSDVFGDRQVGYWPMHMTGIALAPDLKRTNLAYGYYYGSVFRPLTVWVSDVTATHTQPRPDLPAFDSWHAGNRVYVHPRHGREHEGRFFDDGPRGHHGHEHDDPGSNPSPVPLPASWLLLLTGCVALFLSRRSPALLRA